ALRRSSLGSCLVLGVPVGGGGEPGPAPLPPPGPPVGVRGAGGGVGPPSSTFLRSSRALRIAPSISARLAKRLRTLSAPPPPWASPSVAMLASLGVTQSSRKIT